MCQFEPHRARRLGAHLLGAVLAGIGGLAEAPAWAAPAAPSLAAAKPAPQASAPATPTAASLPTPAIAALPLYGEDTTMLYALQDGRLPRVWFDMRFEAGERFVPRRFAGMSQLASDLLDRGPASMPYAQYERELFRQGVEIDWVATNRFLIAQVKCRPDQLATVTALVRRTAEQPRLEPATFRQVAERAVRQRRALDDQMSTLTVLYAQQKVWDFRPEGRAPEGWASSLQAITASDLGHYLQARLTHPATYVTAVGPMLPGKLAKAIAPSLAGWVRPYDGERTAFPADTGKRQAILIDRPGATDNQIYLLSPVALTLGSPQAAAWETYLTGMGGGLSARLGKTLRVERGLTYQAAAGLRRREWPSWYVYTFGGMSQAPALVRGAFEVFAGAQAGLSASEVARAKDQLIKAAANELETPKEQIDAIAEAVALGLPPGAPFERPRAIARVTPAQVQGPAKAAAPLSGATIVLMGDASKLKDALQAALGPSVPLKVMSLAEIEREATASYGATARR